MLLRILAGLLFAGLLRANSPESPSVDAMVEAMLGRVEVWQTDQSQPQRLSDSPASWTADPGGGVAPAPRGPVVSRPVQPSERPDWESLLQGDSAGWGDLADVWETVLWDLPLDQASSGIGDTALSLEDSVWALTGEADRLDAEEASLWLELFGEDAMAADMPSAETSLGHGRRQAWQTWQVAIDEPGLDQTRNPYLEAWEVMEEDRPENRFLMALEAGDPPVVSAGLRPDNAKAHDEPAVWQSVPEASEPAPTRSERSPFAHQREWESVLPQLKRH